MGGRGAVRRGRRRAPRRHVRHLRPAAERDGRAPHGARPQRVDPGRARALAPDARLRHALAAGLRPRGDLDAERRREAAGRGRHLAAGGRPRRVPRADVELARRDRPHDHGAVPAPRRVARLLARAVHDGRRVRRGGDDVLRPALGGRLDLPREPDRQLVPPSPDGDLRPRGRARRDGRHALPRALPVRRRRRRRRDHHRDGAAVDDPRRRRRRGAPRRRAVPGCRRTRGRRPGRRAPRAGDRRRAGRSGVRHRRSQDHAGSRPDRLRDRRHARSRDAHGDRARRPHDRRGLRGPRPEGGRREDRRLARRAGPAREARAVPPLGRHVRALPLADRAARLAAVVVRDGRARTPGDRGPSRAARPLPPGEPAPVRDRVPRAGARLVRLASALVGPSDPDLDVPGRASDVRVAAARRVRRVRHDGAGARPRRARHVVLVGALAVRDARLAGADAGARPLLPRRRQRHGARHHPPLGEPDDLLRPLPPRRDPVHGRDHHVDGPRARRAPDVEEPRHGGRPDGAGRGARRRRDAVRPAQGVVDAGRPLLAEGDRGGTQARDQALERGAPDPPEHRGGGPGAPPGGARGALDPRAARCRPRRGRGRLEPVRLRRGHERALPPHVRRLLRLVRGGGQAAALRRRRGRARDGSRCARAAARAPPSARAARDGGDLVAPPGPRTRG